MSRQPETADRVTDPSEAGRALAEGRLVVAPTETVAGVFARADLEGALAALARATGSGREGLVAAWHAPDAGAVRGALGIEAPLHVRALERLAPGPVTFAVDGAEDRAPVGACVERDDEGGRVLVRVPDHDAARAMLAAAGGPVVALAAARLNGDEDVLQLDAGPEPVGVGSSRVRLLAGGGYRIEREGALSAERIRALLTRTVLFVCTGNTCRSPMAERIARGLLESRGTEPGLEAVSAGVSAGVGAPASEEIWAALRSAGVEVADHEHRSRPVSAELVGRAEAVFAMTEDHARRVRELFPGARVTTLDPAGEDIADPIGGPQALYDETAARLRGLIERRLESLGLIGPGD